MSQPQPAPYYYPPQPPKKSNLGTIIVVVIIVVAFVAGIGGYAAYQYYQTLPGSSTTAGTNSNSVQISGNSITKTVTLSGNSTVQISCNYCTITLQLSSSRVTEDLQIFGNYNHVTATGGQTNLSLSGNYNVVNLQQTVVLSEQDSGAGNNIQR